MNRIARPPGVGVVAIGRNEGERLMRCLRSALDSADAVVYVDSGSSDGSVAAARALGIEIVDLDLRTPFTAARARNEGFRRLRAIAPQLEYVQFVDGDCELVPGWVDQGLAWLSANADVGIVCGRRRERFPERSVYNLLCDIEWDTPVGETRECGGDTLMRSAVFEAAGGFRDDLIAGEEPELCVRIRASGWRIWRLDSEMTRHDAGLTRFGQWWKRAMRGGYAAAQGMRLHGRSPERHRVAASRSIWLWGFALPAATIGASVAWEGWMLALLAIYPAQVVRLALRGGRSARENWWYAAFLVLGKFPELLGQVRFLFRSLAGSKPTLIEYK